MIYYDSEKLDAYLAKNYREHLRPNGPIKLAGMGDGTTRLDEWPEELIGSKAPTVEEVGAYGPPPAVDKAAELGAAMLAAKSGTAAAKATAAVDAIESLNARVAELEKRLGL